MWLAVGAVHTRPPNQQLFSVAMLLRRQYVCVARVAVSWLAVWRLAVGLPCLVCPACAKSIEVCWYAAHACCWPLAMLTGPHVDTVACMSVYVCTWCVCVCVWMCRHAVLLGNVCSLQLQGCMQDCCFGQGHGWGICASYCVHAVDLGGIGALCCKGMCCAADGRDCTPWHAGCVSLCCLRLKNGMCFVLLCRDRLDPTCHRTWSTAALLGPDVLGSCYARDKVYARMHCVGLRMTCLLTRFFCGCPCTTLMAVGATASVMVG
jgi:hypothetical protein